MKRFLILSGLAAIVLLTVYRQRLFLRDPLAKVYRDGVRQESPRVYLNYSNDVLVEESGKGTSPYMVQNWNKTPGVPEALTCLRAMVCLSDHDHATLVPLTAANGAAPATMSDREVSFRQSDGNDIKITLR